MESTATQLGVNTSLFAGFSLEDLEVLAPAVTRREVTRGEVLGAEGDFGGSMFIISAGTIEVRRRLGDTDVPVAKLTRGEACGEMALLGDGTRTADLVAAEDGAILEISRTELEEAVADRPEVAAKLWYNLAVALSHRLASTNVLLSQAVEANQKLAAQTGFRRALGGV